MSKDLPDIKNFGVPTYGLTTDENVNLRISAILNEAEHVFDWHDEGIWKDTYKEGYARLLANELIERPSLMRKLLKLNRRVFSMVAYRAIDLVKEGQNG